MPGWLLAVMFLVLGAAIGVFMRSDSETPESAADSHLRYHLGSLTVTCHWHGGDRRGL